MSYLIRCTGLRGRILNKGGSAPPGWYLAGFDPEFADGYGWVQWTQDPAKAIRYLSLGEAIRAYQTVPRSRPRTETGRVHRPMTAIAVEFVDTRDLTPGGTTVMSE